MSITLITVIGVMDVIVMNGVGFGIGQEPFMSSKTDALWNGLSMWMAMVAIIGL